MKRNISVGIGVTVVLCVCNLLTAQEPAAPAPGKQMMKGKMMTRAVPAAGQPEEKGMMAQHEEAAQLVTQVAADLNALQHESDVAVIKAKLAVDQAALEKVRDQMRAQQAKMKTMMAGMSNDKGASGAKAEPAPSTGAPPAVDHSQHH